MTVEELLQELSEFQKNMKVRLEVEVWDDRQQQTYYHHLDIKACKLVDDEVLIEHE